MVRQKKENIKTIRRKQNGARIKQEKFISYRTLGMLIGLAVGVCIGAATDNIPIGTGGGLSIGLAIGCGIDE
jgi:hypothetical protein